MFLGRQEDRTWLDMPHVARAARKVPMRRSPRANAICAYAADAKGERFDPAPILKFVNPLGAGTWLATELYADDDTLFGLADLGFGYPELGTFLLAEIASVRLPFGMGIERDIAFSSPHPLSLWADTARGAGSVLRAEQLLRRAAPGIRCLLVQLGRLSPCGRLALPRSAIRLGGALSRGE